MHRSKTNHADLNNAWRGTSSRKPSKRRSERRSFERPSHREQEEYLLKSLVREVKTRVHISQRGNELNDLLSGLSHEERHELAALNPYAGTRFRKCIERALADCPTPMDLFAVTIISETLNSDLSGGWVPLEDGQALVAKCLERFDHLMFLQVGFRRISYTARDARGVKGYVYQKWMCVHAHGLVWGSEALIQLALDELPTALGAPGGYMERCYSVRGWLRYSLEDPREIESRGKSTKGVRGFMKQAAAIPQNLQARLVRYFRGVTKPDLCIAAGHGKKVLKRAVEYARQKGYSAQG